MSRRNAKDTVLSILGVILAAELSWLAWMGGAHVSGKIGHACTPLEYAAPTARPASHSILEAEAPPQPEEPDEDDAPVERVPYVETDSEAARREPAAAIEVLGPDLRPCAYASIVAMRGDSVAWRGMTNDIGIESDCPPSDEPVDLVIDACTSLHRVAGVVLEDCERRQVVLPAARAISGRITFDDTPPFPTEQLFVELFRDSEPPAKRDLAPAARKTLERIGLHDARVPVAPDGSFAFTGVDPGFEGHIAIRPVERVVVVDPARPGERALTLPVRADQPLLVHLRRNPVITGTIVKQSTVFGGRRLRVTLFATLADSTVVSRWDGCDLGSRFEIPLDFRTPATVRLEVESLAGEFGRTVSVAGPFDRDVDVGALEPPDEPTSRPRKQDDLDETSIAERRAAYESSRFSWVQRAIRGTVVDEDGAPVARASIEARGASWRGTDENGAFELGDWLPPKVTLRIHARGYLPLDVPELDLDSIDGQTFTMRRGRAVRLIVVDDRGEPFVRPRHFGRCDHGWEAWVTVNAGEEFVPDDGLDPMALRGFGHPESPAGPGVYDFLGLPDGAITFHVEGVEGPIYTLDHDTRVPEARLVVPAHGSIRLRLDTMLDDRRMRVGVEPAFAGGTRLRFTDTTTPYDGTLLLHALLPGDYVVTFERPRTPDWGEWTALGSPVSVTVRAGEMTVVTVGR